jgi:hypothetical protein
MLEEGQGHPLFGKLIFQGGDLPPSPAFDQSLNYFCIFGRDVFSERLFSRTAKTHRQDTELLLGTDSALTISAHR